MTDTRNTGRIKKYGVCLNDKCEKYKQIQEVLHGDLECPECKKKLSPCAPPKKKSNNKLPLIIIGVIAVIAIIAGCAFALSGGSCEESQHAMADSMAIDTTKETSKVNTDTVVKRDTVVVRDTIVKNNTVTTNEKVTTKTVVSTTSAVQSKTSSSGNGTLRLSYGTYSGATKGGYPHGQGRLTYSKTRQINRNDAKGRTANSGDYVIGEFFNGFVVYGKHYDANGNLIGSLNFGVGSEDSYESK